jgi:hypothetical protein
VAFPFGLHSAAGIIFDLVAQRMHPLPVNYEFIGMVDYVVDSVRDPLGSGSETSSDSNSGVGSYHPSLECFMTDVEPERDSTPEGFVEEASDNGSTPLEDVKDGYRTETPKSKSSSTPSQSPGESCATTLDHI